jgi:ERF superfamily
MYDTEPVVAALTSALAKAQAEVINPEKSLTARRVQLPLCAALQRARHRALDAGQHEIATLQTTAIDQSAGMVNLTTTLAHASGEWIASDWPVCPIAEAATPQHMGAALTYARRYGLFHARGMTGEDDLDSHDGRQKI